MDIYVRKCENPSCGHLTSQRQPIHIISLYNNGSINKNNINEMFANRTQWQPLTNSNNETWNSRCHKKRTLRDRQKYLFVNLYQETNEEINTN